MYLHTDMFLFCFRFCVWWTSVSTVTSTWTVLVCLESLYCCELNVSPCCQYMLTCSELPFQFIFLPIPGTGNHWSTLHHDATDACSGAFLYDDCLCMRFSDGEASDYGTSCLSQGFVFCTLLLMPFDDTVTKLMCLHIIAVKWCLAVCVPCFQLSLLLAFSQLLW